MSSAWDKAEFQKAQLAYWSGKKVEPTFKQLYSTGHPSEANSYLASIIVLHHGDASLVFCGYESAWYPSSHCYYYPDKAIDPASCLKKKDAATWNDWELDAPDGWRYHFKMKTIDMVEKQDMNVGDTKEWTVLEGAKQNVIFQRERQESMGGSHAETKVNDYDNFKTGNMEILNHLIEEVTHGLGFPNKEFNPFGCDMLHDIKQKQLQWAEQAWNDQ